MRAITGSLALPLVPLVPVAALPPLRIVLTITPLIPLRTADYVFGSTRVAASEVTAAMESLIKPTAKASEAIFGIDTQIMGPPR